jgi:PAS domain S-box-containing protein
MPIMLIGLNQQLEITQWNHVAEASTGRSISNVLGKNLWEVYPTIALTQEQVKNVLASKETTTIKHSQRDQYYFDITIYALTDKDETGIIILVDDITKQMKAENKVAERDKISAMGELASAMAYDINLPLHTILSILMKVQNKISNNDLPNVKNELLEILENGQKSGQQATEIINNLLDVTSTNDNSKEPTDISQVMDESLELANKLFIDSTGLQFSNIKINRNYTPGLPKIPGIASELRQVFVRLLRNAFYTLNSSVRIDPFISIEISEFYNSLWIKIHYMGEALTPQEQEDIFQPFFSISSRPPACPVERRLSYPYFIITDHHQGQMAVTSDQNFGTTFNIQLSIE